MFASDEAEARLRAALESRPAPAPNEPRRRKQVIVPVALVVLGLVAGAAAVEIGLIPTWSQLRTFAWRRATQAAAADGRLVIQSQPSGADVEIDGVAQGRTPVGLRVKAGHHLVRIGANPRREIEVDVVAGTDVVHHVELPVSSARLRIETVPTGAPVSIDGQARGVAPLDTYDLSVGPHEVLVGAGGAAVRRHVDVQPGLENSIMVTLATPGGGGPSVGWLTVTAPFDLEVYDGSRLVGRSRDERLLLAAGPHDLALVNRELGVDDRRHVQIASGNVAAVRVDARSGLLNVNAEPWAEVFLDGTRIGATPIANFSTPIGTHEVVLRNPDLGEQRRTVTVGLLAPARVGVRFRQ
jgi:hypothetical protein